LNVFYSAIMRLIPDKIVYVMGSGGNYMTTFDTWPIPVSQDLYLCSEGQNALCSDAPSGGSISYKYDPSDPAPTYGGWIFQNTNPNGEGCVDQQPLGSRKDVLQFNGETLVDDLAICGGDITATLSVGSTANDTDFIVRLVDQYPTGERYQVAEGIVRMRWRNKTATPLAMIPSGRYDVEVDMWSNCWIWKTGHRIGIDITSSSSFMFLPNPNTGLPLEEDGIWAPGGEYYKGENITASNTIMFGPSKISLPVVKVSDLPVSGPLVIPSPKAPPAREDLERTGREAMLTQGK
jgi:putative CocE/NonD family hydrolase